MWVLSKRQNRRAKIKPGVIMLIRTVGIMVQPLSHVGKTLLNRVLSPYAKRIFFLTSLYVQLRQLHLNMIHQNTLQKLNQTLHLARNENALMLAAHAHRMVWNGSALNQVVTNDPAYTSVEAKCNAIIQLAPRWMRYGTPEVMVRDIGRLLTESDV